MATAKTETKKTGNTVEATGDVKFALPDPKRGLYSAVGVADYAVSQIRALPRYQGVVVEALQKLPQQLRTQLTSTYSEFADRGEKVVSSIRKDPATQEAVEQAKTAKSQVKAARTSVRKAAADTGSATEKAGDKIG
ncbi:hypothetical protein [Cryptosporangium sp. NPDC048952]|uniref:hypothetical protein n=1 Tax=Cryptosporangium sp. NPDC048952 TaxID=3363961 RepID=UPI00371D6ACD